MTGSTHALRGWLGLAGTLGLLTLAVGGALHPAVAAVTTALWSAGLFGSALLDRFDLSERGRFVLGAVVSAAVLGGAAALPGFGLPELGTAFLAVVLVAGTLERPVWRSMVSLTWVVVLLHVVGAVVADGPRGYAVSAAGIVATLCAIVAGHRVLAAPPTTSAATVLPEPEPQQGSGARRTAGPVGLVRWYLAPVSSALLLATLITATAVDWAAVDWAPVNWVRSLGDRAGNTAPGPTVSGAARRTSAAYAGGGLDLRVRGPLPTTPQFLVPVDAPALWRVGVLDRYDGSSWWESVRYNDPEPLPQGGKDRAVLQGDGGDDVPLAAVAPEGTPTRTFPVRLLDGALAGIPAISPGVLTRLGGPAVAISPSQVVALDPGGGEASAYSVTVADRAGTALPQQVATLEQAGAGAPPVQLDARWLALPDTVTPRTGALAASLAVPADRLGTVKAVETWLRANARYQLDAPVPRTGQDAVDHFLFDARVGFCEQFASAEVVLLRSLGIPARLVTGWVTDGTAAPPSQRADVDGGPAYQVLRADQAHAWVEVWFPGVGWVSSDPTAGTPFAATPAAQGPPGPDDRALVGWSLALLGVIVLAAVWAVRRRRRRRADRQDGWPVLAAAAAGDDPRLLLAHGRLAAAYRRLGAALADVGLGRAPAESLRDLAARLPEQPPAAGALAVVERVLYAAAPPTAAELEAAAARLDEVTAAVAAAAALGRQSVRG